MSVGGGMVCRCSCAALYPVLKLETLYNAEKRLLCVVFICMGTVTRRELLAGAVLLTGSGLAAPTLTSCASQPSGPPLGERRPNVLMIIVDEMRFPMWFPAQEQLDISLPNMARIRRSGISFERHYTAANVCTAARGTLVTGLYSHQTGCQLVGQSTLSPKFPTWGVMLREQGYQCWWYGKWHLGPASNVDPLAFAEYGFSGGTFPSPDGDLGDGLLHDGQITDQFVNWFHDHADKGPWCTTVSLVNPHDIMWWPKWQTPQQVQSRFKSLPPNWETAEQLQQRNAPAAQVDLLQQMQSAGGAMPYAGDDVTQRWTQLLDVYLWLQQQVDVQVGRILDTLASRADIDANTIIVFTADHGDYAGSHGLRMKGLGLYEECIRVPLYLRDPTRILTPDPGMTRKQLTSSVDIAPLLLTIATGDNQWRSQSRYQHLAGRADLAAICRNRGMGGRNWIAHTTDENYANAVPSHVIGLRTPAAKAGLYSFWKTGTFEIDTTAEQDHEFYDYTTEVGRLELATQTKPLTQKAQQLLELLKNKIIPEEIRQPLPNYLKEAQEEGFADLEKATKEGARLG